MNKKQIVITAGIGLICFAASFTVGLFTGTPEEVATAEGGEPDGAQVVESLTADTDPTDMTSSSDVASLGNFQPKQVSLKRSLALKQLNSLTFEMRSKLVEFTSKEKMLAEKEDRIQMSIDELQKNIKEMEELRVKLAASVSAIKRQKKELDERLIQIEEIEKVNLVKHASMYDKMKASQSSEMIINLSKLNQLDNAVKIAYYMTERTSANMLAEISKKQPELAATMSNKLLWIEEVKQ